MSLSLFLSGGDDPRLLLHIADIAREAERRGLTALWLPETEGSPNPAITAAALAVATRRIALRAGGLSLPLHNPIRVAEEWSLVDNLSGGRTGIAFKPGDLSHVETVRRLWRGEAERVPDGEGRPIDIRIHPQPIQKELPLWLTDGRAATAMGTNLLALDENEIPLYHGGSVTVVAPIEDLERLEGIADELAVRVDLADALSVLETLHGR